MFFYFEFKGEGNTRLDGLSGYLPGMSDVYDQSIVNLFTGGRLTPNHKLDWYGVYRDKGGSASPVFLRSGKTSLTIGSRQAYHPGSNIPLDGSAVESALKSMASEELESIICDSIPVPGCSFAWAAISGAGEYEMSSYRPEPDYVVGNGPVTYYYMFTGSATLTHSGAEGNGALTVYYTTSIWP